MTDNTKSAMPEQDTGPSEMVERVARALYEHDDWLDIDTEWDECGETIKSRYRERACAAIEAIPRGGFDVTAGIAALGSDDDRPAATVVGDVVRAVMEAALAEDTGPSAIGDGERAGGGAEPRRFGQWAGKPDGYPEDPNCCIKEVQRDTRSPLFRQCARKRGFGKDGLYCRQHAQWHPAPAASAQDTGAADDR